MRGIVVGDVFRRLIARTIAQEIGETVQSATAPHQYALKTRTGTECVSHILQTLVESDADATIVSIDGIGAFDLVSRNAMLRGLKEMDTGDRVLPFVRRFYGQLSLHIWEDQVGDVQDIHQGEGGDQGDPLMPLLFSLAMHPSLVSTGDLLREGEKLFCLFGRRVSHLQTREGVGGFPSHRERTVDPLQDQRAFREDSGTEDLTRAARALNPDAVVWRGDHRLPVVKQGVVVLGSPVGHDEFIKAKLMSKVTAHQTLLERIPLVRDVQSAWLVLLFCPATRANYWLRTVRPDLTLQFAMAHDHDVLVSLSRLLEVPVETFELNATMSLPLSKGGLGLRSAVRSREAAHWASWADCLPMVQKRHPQVAGIMLQGLNGGGEMASMNVVRECVASLADAGCVLPSWFELVDGVRPPVPEGTSDPFQPRQGWQHFVWNTVEELHLREALPALPPPQRSLVRSQGGPLSSRPFVCCPTSRSFCPSLSVCCSSVVSTCPSPCLPVTAGVAVHSTALATTGQLARLQGCWGGVGSLSRAPSPGFAEREAHACP